MIQDRTKRSPEQKALDFATAYSGGLHDGKLMDHLRQLANPMPVTGRFSCRDPAMTNPPRRGRLAHYAADAESLDRADVKRGLVPYILGSVSGRFANHDPRFAGFEEVSRLDAGGWVRFGKRLPRKPTRKQRRLAAQLKRVRPVLGKREWQ